MKEIAIRELRAGMTVKIGDKFAKICSATIMNGQNGEPPTISTGDAQFRRKSAMAIKIELTIIAHPAETLRIVDEI